MCKISPLCDTFHNFCRIVNGATKGGGVDEPLAEEAATGFRRRFPLGPMSRARFVGINVLLYSYCVVTWMLLKQGQPAGRPLACTMALGMAGNGAGHLGIMLQRRS